MDLRVIVKWTDTAKEMLKGLPLKVRQGLLRKADELAAGGDPREACKPLVGPLQGCYRIVYSRYRAIFTVKEYRQADGRTVLQLTVIFIAAGIRKELDRKDVYRVARKLVELLPELSDDMGGPDM